MGVLGGLLEYMESPVVKRRRKLGDYYVSYSITVSFHGCVVVILMRSYLIVKRKEVPLERRAVC
jgi:hypothetical protein